MLERISNTWSLMGASWRILQQDKGLLVLPLLSGLGCALVLGSFAWPLWQSGLLEAQAQAPRVQETWVYAVLFVFYVASYFVITFFNSALIACALRRMDGQEPSVGDGLRDAWARLPQIAGWALAAGTVGLGLRILEDRSALLGRIVAGLLGMAWTVTSFLVVPVLVMEGKGPVTAWRASTRLLRRTWGDQLVGTFSFGVLFLALSLPAVVVIFLGIASGSTEVAVLSVAAAALYLVVLALVQSALQSIFQAAVYWYARHESAPAGFPGGLLAHAMHTR